MFKKKKQKEAELSENSPAEIKPKKNKKHRHFLWTAIGALGMVLCFVMIWGFTADWGSVKVSRISFTYSAESDGTGTYTGSYLIYKPNSATKENPGQLIVLFHGGTSNSFAVKNYAIEYARRGYVVVTADLPGTGYSDNVGTSTTDEGDLAFLEALQEQLEAMNFVIQGEFSAVGFSNGATTAYNMISMYPDSYISYGSLTNYRDSQQELIVDLGITYWGIQAAGSRSSDSVSTGTRTRSEEYADGGLEVEENYACYYTKRGYVHVLMPDSVEMVSAAIVLQEIFVPTDTTLSSSNLVFWYAEIFSMLGLIMMIVFLVNLCGFLMETEFFASLKQTERPVLAIKPQTRKKKLLHWGRIIIEICVFVVLYKLIGGKIKIPTTAFTPIWINNLMVYLLIFAAYQIVKFIIWHYKGKKNGTGNFVDYGITFGSAKQTAINIGKSAIMAAIGLVFIIGLIDYMNNTLGINYQFMVFTMSSLPLKKLAATPAYILMYIVIFFGGQITAYVVDRVASYSNSWFGTLLDSLKGAIITIAPILIWCFINFLVWKEFLPTAYRDGVSDRLYGYVFMVLITAPLHAFIYKKSNNIWPGLFMCAGLMTFMVCANYPLSITYFG